MHTLITVGILLGLCDMEIQNCFYFGLETSDSWSEIQPTELFPERLSVSRRVCLLQLIELEAKTAHTPYYGELR